MSLFDRGQAGAINPIADIRAAQERLRTIAMAPPTPICAQHHWLLAVSGECVCLNCGLPPTPTEWRAITAALNRYHAEHHTELHQATDDAVTRALGPHRISRTNRALGLAAAVCFVAGIGVGITHAIVGLGILGALAIFVSFGAAWALASTALLSNLIESRSSEDA